MDNYENPIIISLPARRVSRRNYRHPRRLYHRAARRKNSDIIYLVAEFIYRQMTEPYR